VLLLSWLAVVPLADAMRPAMIENLRRETVDLFYHGYNNYLRYAFPEDELRPVTCGALTRDWENPAHFELNDALGNYSLTLIDSLSTLAILASSPENRREKGWLAGLAANSPLDDFQDGIKLLVEYYGDGSDGPSGHGKRARGFDLDSKVQVFETVIRGVGGLLSAHLFAVGDLPIKGYHARKEVRRQKSGIFWKNGLVYDGQLLRLAKDLAERLLPAFYSPTDLPYPRVNLRTGVPFYPNSPYNVDPENGECPNGQKVSEEITETCSAGAGSLLLEFSTLSRLTGDMRYENLAKAAFWAVWDRRSSINLIGGGIDAESGDWVSAYSGVGAGIDSFFEYAFKGHILLSGLPFDESAPKSHSPDEFLKAWQMAHAAIKRHVYRDGASQHPHYIQSDLYTGAARAFWIDSLSAYYPGLLTLSGHLEEATAAHLLYTALWTRYSAMPERWSTYTGEIESGLRWWGGRPEFVESTWYLYRATRDPWYLHVGEMALRDIKRRSWTKCGWAGLQDVQSGEKMDRMESFFLGETAKYLYLLFDVDHPLNHLDSSFVFTTEGHPLIIRNSTSEVSRVPGVRFQRLTDDKKPKLENCPVPPPPLPLTVSTTAARDDIFHAASMARIEKRPTTEYPQSHLQDFTHDHPSISIEDLQSPSNYTYYPWTLPLDLVPVDGTCASMLNQLAFDLSFPSFPTVNTNLLSVRRVLDGIMVNSMSGIRLGMIKEYVSSIGDVFRINAVSSVTLGRDEKVFMTRETISSINPVDPYFTRVRDTSRLDLIVDYADEVQTESRNYSAPEVDEDAAIPQLTLKLKSGEQSEDDPSIFSSLIQSLQSMLHSLPTASPETPAAGGRMKRERIVASIPIGPGAAVFASSADQDPPETDPASATSALAWSRVHVSASNLCDHVLPADVAREHQVVVVPRGGCSFSTKLRHVPAFPPSPRALQLLVVVSFPEHEASDEEAGAGDTPGEAARDGGGDGGRGDFEHIVREERMIQPHLDVPQMTPAGILRPNPIPMVMIYGGEETMALLQSAKGVAVRRRWWFESQGLRIGNLIVV
jgi:hypothetical protein